VAHGLAITALTLGECFDLIYCGAIYITLPIQFSLSLCWTDLTHIYRPKSRYMQPGLKKSVSLCIRTEWLMGGFLPSVDLPRESQTYRGR
jgi:hypothetical protein